jgi:exonuclease III
MTTPALRLSTWNVRTLTLGFSNDLQEINDSRKTAAIDMKLSRLRMDIVALQETRLPGSGSVRKKNFPSSGRENQQRKPMNAE